MNIYISNKQAQELTEVFFEDTKFFNHMCAKLIRRKLYDTLYIDEYLENKAKKHSEDSY